MAVSVLKFDRALNQFRIFNGILFIYGIVQVVLYIIQAVLNNCNTIELALGLFTIQKGVFCFISLSNMFIGNRNCGTAIICTIGCILSIICNVIVIVATIIIFKSTFGYCAIPYKNLRIGIIGTNACELVTSFMNIYLIWSLWSGKTSMLRDKLIIDETSTARDNV